VVKPYAAMGGLHAPLDALFEIGAKRKLVANEIERIEIDLSHVVFHHGWWVLERPLTPIGAQMNIAYALAVAVLDGAAMVQQFSPARIDRDDVWALIPRIVARHEPEFDIGGREGRFRTRLRVKFRDGAQIEVARAGSRAVEEPQSNAEIVRKFRTLTDGLITRERQAAIERAIAGLEELADIDTLVRLLAPPVAAAF
jgi:2-methylcitrate dehydratase PrpD